MSSLKHVIRVVPYVIVAAIATAATTTPLPSALIILGCALAFIGLLSRRPRRPVAVENDTASVG